MLAVDLPQRILNNLQCDTLENAFLELCNRKGNFYETTFGRKEIENFKYKDSTEEEPYKRSKTRAALARIRMLNIKNSRIILRHIAYYIYGKFFLRYFLIPHHFFSGLYCILALPIVIVLTIYGLFGLEPKNINLGIVNDGTECLKTLNTSTCNLENLPCQFLRFIDNETFNSVSFRIFVISQLKNGLLPDSL
jgi:hypothetical protein